MRLVATINHADTEYTVYCNELTGAFYAYAPCSEHRLAIEAQHFTSLSAALYMISTLIRD
jgi:hypothetical protein